MMKNIDLKSDDDLWGMLDETERQAFIKSLQTGPSQFYRTIRREIPTILLK